MESEQPEFATSEELFDTNTGHEVSIPLHMNAEDEFRLDHSNEELKPPPEEPPQLPEHHDKSIWHNIPLDETDHAMQDPSLYGKEFHHEQQQEAPKQDDDELAAASGQLAVGTSTNVDADQPEEKKSKVLEDNSLHQITDRVMSALRGGQQLLNGSSAAADALLWGVLIIIIIAIIAALRS